MKVIQAVVAVALLLTLPSCRTTGSKAADLKNEVAPDANDLGLKPIFVISDWGGLDEVGQKILVESMERASKKALQGILADVTLGKQAPGPGLVARAVKMLDDELAREAAAGPLHDLLMNTEQTSAAEIALMLVDRATPIPAESQVGTLSSFKSGSMQALGAILQMAAPRMSAQDFETLAARTANFASTPVIRPEDSWTMQQANAAAYMRVAAQHRDKWVVMRAKLMMQVTPKMLSVNMDTRLKPTSQNSSVNQQTGVVGISAMNYVPGFTATAEQPSIAQFTMSRLYRADQPTGGITAKMRFGQLISQQDLTTIIQCNSRCAEEAMVGQIGRYYPTIRGSFRPETFGENGYDWLQPAMQVIAGALAEYNQVSILLRSVGIDFSNPALPKVTPENSSFSMIVGDGEDSIQLSRESNITFGGFDVYNGVIASQIADGLSGEVQSQLATENQASSNAVADQLAGFARLFDSGATDGDF